MKTPNQNTKIEPPKLTLTFPTATHVAHGNRKLVEPQTPTGVNTFAGVVIVERALLTKGQKARAMIGGLFVIGEMTT